MASRGVRITIIPSGGLDDGLTIAGGRSFPARCMHLAEVASNRPLVDVTLVRAPVRERFVRAVTRGGFDVTHVAAHGLVLNSVLVRSDVLAGTGP